MARSNGRYGTIPTATLRIHSGRGTSSEVAYLRRRFIPPPIGTGEEHTVREGDRPDLLADQHLGDSERAWELCDENQALDPGDLISRPGQRLRIPPPRV